MMNTFSDESLDVEFNIDKYFFEENLIFNIAKQDMESPFFGHVEQGELLAATPGEINDLKFDVFNDYFNDEIEEGEEPVINQIHQIYKHSEAESSTSSTTSYFLSQIKRKKKNPTNQKNGEGSDHIKSLLTDRQLTHRVTAEADTSVFSSPIQLIELTSSENANEEKRVPECQELSEEMVEEIFRIQSADIVRADDYEDNVINVETSENEESSEGESETESEKLTCEEREEAGEEISLIQTADSVDTDDYEDNVINVDTSDNEESSEGESETESEELTCEEISEDESETESKELTCEEREEAAEEIFSIQTADSFGADDYEDNVINVDTSDNEESSEEDILSKSIKNITLKNFKKEMKGLRHTRKFDLYQKYI